MGVGCCFIGVCHFSVSNLMSRPSLLSRGAKQAFIAEHLDLSVLDGSQHSLIYPLGFNQPRPGISKSELLRYVFLTPELSPFRKLSNADLAKFLGCSEPNVSRILCTLGATPNPEVAVSPGRPTILSEGSERAISEWLNERITTMQWPTLSAFREKVFSFLDLEAPDFVPGRQFLYDLLARLSKGQDHIRSDSGLGPLRYEVTPDMIQDYFKVLHAIKIQEIDPHLIINIDETGFWVKFEWQSEVAESNRSNHIFWLTCV